MYKGMSRVYRENFMYMTFRYTTTFLVDFFPHDCFLYLHIYLFILLLFLHVYGRGNYGFICFGKRVGFAY